MGLTILDGQRTSSTAEDDFEQKDDEIEEGDKKESSAGDSLSTSGSFI